MADIPFSPTVKEIVETHGVNTRGVIDRKGFIDFLREVADKLSETIQEA